MALKEALQFCSQVVQSTAWDTSNAIVELASLGRHLWWWKLRWRYFELYWPEGPVRISWRETAAFQSADQFTYGETPPASFVHMLRCIQAGPKDTVIDLGCGPGVHLLAASRKLGVKVRGFDLIPGFIARGRILIRELGLQDRAEFVECDLLEANLSDATIVYVAGTTFRPERRDKSFSNGCRGYLRGTRIITLDWTLREPDFHFIGGRAYPVSWGWTAVNVFEV